MIEFYPQIKAIHIAAVIASGVLFFLRGAAVHTGRSWAMAAPVRYASYLIDTALLIAAMMLATLLHQYPFVHAWLTAKVLLLVVYIGLGTFALKRGATRKIRVWCWIAAMIVYGFIISIARAHHPLGVFAEASGPQAQSLAYLLVPARSVLAIIHDRADRTADDGAGRWLTEEPANCRAG